MYVNLGGTALPIIFCNATLLSALENLKWSGIN